MALSARIFAVTACFVLLAAAGAQADVRRGQYVFSNERSCTLGGKLSNEQCANAAANAQAEFDEKAPRFPSREACEKSFSGGCSLGFKGAEGWTGKKGGIYFSPRLQGFRVVVASERDMTVTPVSSGAAVNFSPRTILRKDTHINFADAHRARDNWRPTAAAYPSSGGGAGSQFGVDAPPPGEHGALPPPPPVDPNFDCAAVLEPNARDHADTGCYLAPARHRH